jgi:hypothetical protein
LKGPVFLEDGFFNGAFSETTHPSPASLRLAEKLVFLEQKKPFSWIFQEVAGIPGQPPIDMESAAQR